MSEHAPQDGKKRLVPAPTANLCIAFTDTRYWRASAEPVETLSALGDALNWCEGAQVLTSEETAKMRRWEEEHPALAGPLFTALLEARDAIYALFARVSEGKPAPHGEMAALNRLFDQAPRRAEVSQKESGFAWRVAPMAPTPASLLAPVLWSATDLLVGDRLSRVHRCANPKCGGLFLDDSKSGTRRWCMMSVCGNRAKAHRHYLRKTGKAKTP